MPIYEYVCMECESHFEELVRSEQQAIACPDCTATNVRKQFSTFTARVSAPAPSLTRPAGRSHGGGCCGGSCGC